MDAREKLDSQINDWIDTASPQETTMLVRLAFSKDAEQAAAELTQQGFSIQSSGPGLLVGSGIPSVVEKVIQEPWVIKIEAPANLNLNSDWSMLYSI